METNETWPDTCLEQHIHHFEGCLFKLHWAPNQIYPWQAKLQLSLPLVVAMGKPNSSKISNLPQLADFWSNSRNIHIKSLMTSCFFLKYQRIFLWWRKFASIALNKLYSPFLWMGFTSSRYSRLWLSIVLVKVLVKIFSFEVSRLPKNASVGPKSA